MRQLASGVSRTLVGEVIPRIGILLLQGAWMLGFAALRLTASERAFRQKRIDYYTLRFGKR